jgi:hypothetical protein
MSSDVVALSVARGRIVDLEEELEDLPIGRSGAVKDDFDRLGVSAVVAIGGVLDLTAGVAHAGAEDAVALADQILHPPETPAGENCGLRLMHWLHASSSSLRSHEFDSPQIWGAENHP